MVKKNVSGHDKLTAHLRSLIDRSAQINEPVTPTGNTKLMIAVQLEDLKLINGLIFNGADVNSRNERQETPMHLAAKYNNGVEVLKILQENGADLNAKDIVGETPTDKAILYNNVTAFKYLMKQGIDFNNVNNYGDTAVHHAVCNKGEKGIQILKFLAKHGVELNIQNNWGATPVHLAAFHNNVKALKYLLKHGLDLNARTNEGTNALHHAVLEHNVEAMRYLVEKGADVNAKDNASETPLHKAAVKNSLENSLEVFQYLVKHGAEINVKNDMGETPLMRSVTGPNPAPARYLILSGADYVSKNKYNQSVFTIARQYGRKNMPDSLLQAIKHRQQNDTASFLKYPVDKQIEQLKSDRLLRALVLKLNVLGKLLNSLTYEESKKLYSSVLIKLPVEKKIIIRHQIHAKRMENCL